ncbi:phosphonate transport system ATP-binding protein [Evansella vedderi]|uniref:Phosphonate transport system ATP-binding protein n=1 Tax=Evansella vedderi TaxID=38282 RepID=A0ABT9ZN20_9BACI|nr:phosphonate ABC transporter ATP-binding protein [Evansella vedderi]MDQ0252629.1 phosphonate transport system ATP-binding protein [Evansella vedderi]
MIVLEDVSVRYKKAEDEAIKSLSTSFRKGEFICVLGKSGAGKSTFIRCVNGLQQPSSGEVVVNDVSLTTLKEEELRKIRRNIGMIFQHYYLIPRLTVMQNVLTGTFGKRKPWKNLMGIFSSEEKEKAIAALKAVELEQFADRRVEALSGGQKQRVGIARALVQDPYIFLGDEPVASLDPSTAIKIFKLLKQIHEEKELVTIINVHDVQLAKRFATRIIALKNGELIFDGAPELLTEEVMTEIYGEGYEEQK